MTGLVMRPRVAPVGNGVSSVNDTIVSCKGVGQAYRYCHGQSEPNYPVPSIRYEDMLINMNGEQKLVVVYPNQWCGYATMVANYF